MTALRRTFLVPLGLLALACLAAACSHAATGFSAVNAEQHVRRLAGDIGSRPAGSEANRRAREYLVQVLRGAGFDVRVQQADAERPGLGLTARVANIIATRPGASQDLIALMAHYDSVPDGPGAADDGFGTAVCVEAGRVLAARPSPRYSIAVILTDGEELGLMGAAALLKDPVRARIRAVFNFEAIGSGSPVALFETGPGSGGLIAAWARAAPRPAGASFMPEVYGAISRGGDRTDLGLFRRAGVAGLDFAVVGDGYTYHTPLDAPARLDGAALLQAGGNTIAAVEALERAGLASSRDETVSTYFDLLRLRAVRYGHGVELAVFGLAILIGLVAWFHVVGIARRGTRPRRLLMTLPWLLVGCAAIGAAMLGAAWLLRATREELHPWYAHPDWFFAWLALAAIVAGWALLRAGRALPAGLRGSASPAAVWVMTLPVWIAVTVLAGWHAPASAFLIAWPLLAAGVALLAFPVERPRGMRAAGLTVALVVGAIWGTDVVLLLRFAVTELGRTPIVTPLFLYPAALLAAGVVVAPPVLALLGPGAEARADESAPRGWLGGGVLVLVAATAFAACWLAPAYTANRPRHRAITYLADASGTAVWETGSNEPAPPPGGAQWQPGPSSFPVASSVSRLSLPFVHHAAAPAPAFAPFRVAGSVVRSGEAVLEIHAVPAAPGWTIAFALPPDVIPLETNLAISLRRGRQVAVFQAVPPEGVTFRGRFELSDAAKLSGTTVVALGAGVPGAAAPNVPAWLPQSVDTWQARSYYLLPVQWDARDEPQAPVPAR